MFDDAFILRIERLRDDLESLKRELQRRYKSPQRVNAAQLRETARQLAEVWMVEVAPRDDVRAVVSEDLFAELGIQFQRLLQYSDQSTSRNKYDASLRAILKDFRNNVIVCLKQALVSSPTGAMPASLNPPTGCNSAFVGHSFAAVDESVVACVTTFLAKSGITVVTGEKPRAKNVSAKVKERIDACDTFVGVFTRQDKLSGKEQWIASPWIIDEKAYALAKGKRLVLIKEDGVANIGGLQGDYEYLPFDRGKLVDLVFRMMEVFRVQAVGFADD